MRYNDYKNDPYSIDTTGNPNPMYAICSRGDLKSKGPSPGGCYDTKLTSYNYGAKDLKAQAINGPLTKSNRKIRGITKGFEARKCHIQMKT